MILTESFNGSVGLSGKEVASTKSTDDHGSSKKSTEFLDSCVAIFVLSLLLVLLSFLTGSVFISVVKRQRHTDRTHLAPITSSLRREENAIGVWFCPTPSHGLSVLESSLHLPSCERDDVDDDGGEDDLVRKHLLVDVLDCCNGTRFTQNSVLLVVNLLLDVLHEQLQSFSCIESTDAVNCVGIAARSRVSVRSFHQSDLLAFDIFSYGHKSLISVLSVLEHHLHDTNSGCSPRIKWTQKIRGDFRDGVDRTLSEAGVGNIDASKRIVESVESDFQHIHIWETNRPGKHHPGEHSEQESFYSLSGDLDRIVYLDDTSQSRKFGESAYHEGLVHPAMFSHEHPSRVAIIGGGEGATLREILKHNTVQKVLMIEIDRVMVETSRKHLPEWSYCGNLVGSAESCFDDPRVELHYSDAMAWFIDHFRDRSTIDSAELFDVVIMDALDPSTVVEFSDVLYKSDDLIIALYNGLTRRGVFSIQIGQSTFMDEPPMTHLRDDQLVSLLHHFLEVGFQSVLHYDEAHSGFQSPWAYLVVMKDEAARAHWFRGQAEMELAIRRRSLRTWHNETPFRFFDGATMMSWKFPQRPVEEVWCRLEPRPSNCRGHGFDPDEPLHSTSNGTALDAVNRAHSDQRVISILSSLSEATGLQMWLQLETVVIDGTACLRVRIFNRCLHFFIEVD